MLGIKKNLKHSLILLLIALLAIFLLETPLKNLAFQALSPIQKVFYNLGSNLGKKLTPFFIKKNLVEENKILRERLVGLYKENADLKLREKDYQILKIQLEFLEKHEWMECKAKSRLEGGTESCYILSQVIGQTPEPLSQTLIIDKGSKDGLKEGLAVIVDDGILIGKLTKVNKNVSQVLLLLDNQSRIASAILETPTLSDQRERGKGADRIPWQTQKSSSTSVQGIIKSQHDLSLIMDLIPLDKKIFPGDPVITSGLEPNIPSGLLIGYVDSLETSPNQLFQKATVHPLTNFEGLRIVSVLIP